MSDAHGVARDQLRSFIERIERLEDEKKTIADDIKDIYGEAKGTGFDTKILRKVIQIRKQDRDERAEQEAILDSYLAALGMLIQPDFVEDEPRQSAQAESRSAAPLRSDADLSIVSKHTEITTSGGSSSAPSSLTTREAEASVVPHSPETATEVQSASTDAPETPGKQCTSVVSKDEAGQNLTGNHSSDQPLTGGDHEVTAIAERDRDIPTSNTGEGTALSALPASSGVTLEYVPPSGVKRLPFASCFPELSKADYERLEKDIAANRVQTPIIRQGDVIVDGWARYTISRTYGLSYPVQEYSGADVLLDVIEWQRASRKFTPAQEKKIAADLAKEFPHRADEIMTAFGLVEALEAAE